MGAPRGRLALVRRQLWPAAYPDRGGQNYTVRVTRAYLDHAATAPLRPEAGEEFLRVARELGNPNAIHTFGRNARRYLDEAREEVAELLGAEPAEVIFTSGGTEADNLAVQGGWFAASEERPGIIVSAVEHPAVIETAHWLRSQHGAKLHVAPVTSSGAGDLPALSDYLEAAGPGVSVVSVMWANNETGVLQLRSEENTSELQT